MKYKIKLFLQFIYYVLLGENDFKLSVFRRLKFAFCGGFTPNQIVLYDLPNCDKTDYLSEFDWFKSRKLNRPYDMVLNNKFITAELIKDKILIPKNYAIKLNGQVRVLNGVGNPKTDGLLEIIKNAGSVIMKPVMAGKGNGVFKISCLNSCFMINDAPKCDSEIKELLSEHDNWIICENVVQHEYSAKIYNGSVNTIRIVVIKDEDNKPYITCAVHRFGTSETGVVDNASMGGLVSNIDLETGVMSEAKSIKKLDIYDVHPNTGVLIKNKVVPLWEETKEKILKVSSAMPYLKLIAWDVVITENGPCVIEGNSSSGVNILQLWGGLKKQPFGEYLKKQGVIN